MKYGEYTCGYKKVIKSNVFFIKILKNKKIVIRQINMKKKINKNIDTRIK